MAATTTTPYETPACFVCHEKSVITLHEDELAAYEAGGYIQDCFPELSVDQRELIKTGTHPDCWDTIFGDEEDGGY